MTKLGLISAFIFGTVCLYGPISEREPKNVITPFQTSVLETRDHRSLSSYSTMSRLSTNKARKAVTSFIELLFRAKKINKAFEENFSFSTLSQEEVGEFDSTSLRYPDWAGSLDRETVASILGSEWFYEFQGAFLALGTQRLEAFDKAFSTSQSEIDEERRLILANHGVSEQRFYEIVGGHRSKELKILQQDLADVERINADILNFIQRKSDEDLYSRNIDKIEKRIAIKKIATAKGNLYVAQVAPLFNLSLREEQGQCRIIALWDTR